MTSVEILGKASLYERSDSRGSESYPKRGDFLDWRFETEKAFIQGEDQRAASKNLPKITTCRSYGRYWVQGYRAGGLLNEIKCPDDKHSLARFTFYTFLSGRLTTNIPCSNLASEWPLNSLGVPLFNLVFQINAPLYTDYVFFFPSCDVFCFLSLFYWHRDVKENRKDAICRSFKNTRKFYFLNKFCNFKRICLPIFRINLCL